MKYYINNQKVYLSLTNVLVGFNQNSMSSFEEKSLCLVDVKFVNREFMGVNNIVLNSKNHYYITKLFFDNAFIEIPFSHIPKDIRAEMVKNKLKK